MIELSPKDDENRLGPLGGKWNFSILQAFQASSTAAVQGRWARRDCLSTAEKDGRGRSASVTAGGESNAADPPPMSRLLGDDSDAKLTKRPAAAEAKRQRGGGAVGVASQAVCGGPLYPRSRGERG